MGGKRAVTESPGEAQKGDTLCFYPTFPPLLFIFQKKRGRRERKKKKLLIFCLCFLTVCISCRVFVAWCCCPFSSSPNSHSQKKLKVTLFHQQRLSGKNSQRNSQPLVQSGLQITQGGNNVFESLDLGRNNKKILSEEQKKKRFWAPVRL